MTPEGDEVEKYRERDARAYTPSPGSGPTTIHSDIGKESNHIPNEKPAFL
jgi:hypothetical protein